MLQHLIIIKFYTFFSLIYRQITTCLKHGFVDGVLPFPLIMMFFTSFFVGILDYFIGVIDSFKIFFGNENISFNFITQINTPINFLQFLKNL